MFRSHPKTMMLKNAFVRDVCIQAGRAALLFVYEKTIGSWTDTSRGGIALRICSFLS
jgi:hypothetical protein